MAHLADNPAALLGAVQPVFRGRTPGVDAVLKCQRPGSRAQQLTSLQRKWGKAPVKACHEQTPRALVKLDDVFEFVGAHAKGLLDEDIFAGLQSLAHQRSVGGMRSRDKNG